MCSVMRVIGHSFLLECPPAHPPHLPRHPMGVLWPVLARLLLVVCVLLLKRYSLITHLPRLATKWNHLRGLNGRTCNQQGNSAQA